MTATMCETRAPTANGDQALMGLSRLLGLTAAPVFIAMALFTGLSGRDAMAICGSVAMGSLSLGGMSVMYGLMAVIHAGPWLELLQRRGRRTASANPLDEMNLPATVEWSAAGASLHRVGHGAPPQAERNPKCNMHF